MHRKNNNLGFTLVELSIVLVIIGLLIGGILVAQSMIKTTKILNTVKQISQFDIALANFITKYNQLPGDSTLFGEPNLGWAFNNNRQSDGPGYESSVAWKHLSQGVGLKNIYGTDYIPYDPFNVPGGPINQYSCPILDKLENNPAATAPCLVLAWPAWASPGTGYYIYQGDAPAFAQTSGILSPKTVLALDTKVDDGANSGNVSAFGAGCVSGTRYVTSDSFSCLSVYIMTGFMTSVAN